MLLFAPFLFTYPLSPPTCCSVTFSPSHTINQPLSEVSGGMQVPIVRVCGTQSASNNLLGQSLLTFLLFLLMLLILFYKQDLFPLSTPHPHPPTHTPSMSTTPITPPPSTLYLSPPHILSAFIYLWVALIVFLWWITLSSCMLLSSVTGGEEQQQSCSCNSGSICISVCEPDW